MKSPNKATAIATATGTIFFLGACETTPDVPSKTCKTAPVKPGDAASVFVDKLAREIQGEQNTAAIAQTIGNLSAGSYITICYEYDGTNGKWTYEKTEDTDKDGVAEKIVEFGESDDAPLAK